MSNGFKRFIKTSGLTFEEIKAKIKKMAVDLAVDIVDDATQLMPKEIRSKTKQAIRDLHNKTEYRPEKIPQKKDPKLIADNREFMVTKIYSKAGSIANISGDRAFSDEEYKTLFGDEAGENGNLHYGHLHERKNDPQGGMPEASYNDPAVIAYPHEAVIGDQGEQDEYMAEKIRQMRQLEEVSHNGYVVKRSVEITMVRQGEFMKDVEDDYLHNAFCGVQRPVYAALSRSQLRTYFTWRTEWRRGIHSVTDKPYVLLYCYEVLNKIGFDSAAAFRELLLIWNELGEHASYLRDFLPRWIKDFYAFNRVEDPLPEFPMEPQRNCGIAEVCFEILNGNFNNMLDYLADNSSYNIWGSIFVNSKNRSYLDGACGAALRALDEHFKNFGVELSGLICGKMKKDFSWEPFCGAPVDLDRMDGFEPLHINELERYCKKRGVPALETFEFAPSKDLIGYVLKCVEAQLRKIMTFSHKLSPNINMIKNELANRSKLQSAVSDKSFDTLIANAVDGYCRQNHIGVFKLTDDNAADSSPLNVKINISKLGEIREQTERNTELLVIPHHDEKERMSEDRIRQVAGSAEDDEFSETVAIASVTADISDVDHSSGSIGVLTSDKFVITDPENVDRTVNIQSGAIDQLPEEWRKFAFELLPVHIPAMKHIMDRTISVFCSEHGLFAKTLYEEINSAALNAIGDVIIEDGVFVEDYKNTVAKLLEFLNNGHL